MRDNAELLANLKDVREVIVSRLKILKGYLKSLEAVIEMFTTLSPKEIALNAINENPDQIWTAKGIVSELRHAHEILKLDREIINPMQIAGDVLCRLCRENILERIGLGQYRKTKPLMVSVSAIKNLQDKHERWRQKQQEKGLCTKCSRPATSKTLCDYHRQKKRESNQQQRRIKWTSTQDTRQDEPTRDAVAMNQQQKETERC